MSYFRVGTCDVCQRDREVGVASLPFAPMSVAFCRECLEHNAYPLWALHAQYEMVGGPKNAADWFKGLSSFVDGQYIDGKDVLSRYVHPTEEPQG